MKVFPYCGYALISLVILLSIDFPFVYNFSLLKTILPVKLTYLCKRFFVYMKVFPEDGKLEIEYCYIEYAKYLF